MPDRRKWAWYLAWEIPLLALTGAALQYWHAIPPPISASLGIHVTELRQGEVRIGWDRAAKPVTHAVRGVLNLKQGVETQSISLTPEMLAEGSYTHPRVTDGIQARLVLFDLAGNATQEESGFLGQPLEGPSQSPAPSELRERGDDLESQLRWLRTKNERQSARIRELELALMRLETKLGIAARE